MSLDSPSPEAQQTVEERYSRSPDSVRDQENQSSPTARSTSPPGSSFHETRFGWLVLALVWAACAIYLLVHLREGWIPCDAGMLAEEALRTLHGQVPHRDFMEVYTGGLTYLNALAFRIFGVSIFSLRIPLFLFFLGWVPSVYFIARRFAGPVAAGAVTLLAVAWSVPNYPEAMPTWYNLYFATWGLLALFRYTETERRRWLWIAGVCAGFSFLFKIVGLYFVAAALLFFVFRELSLAQESTSSQKRGDFLYRTFVCAGLLLFIGALLDLVLKRPTIADMAYFVLPSMCLAALLLQETLRRKTRSSRIPFRRLLTMGLPFLGGTLLPVLIFLAWYVKEGALAAWFQGTFFRATAHLLWGAFNPRPLAVAAGLIPAVAVVLLACRRSPSARRFAGFGSPLALTILLVMCWKYNLARLFISGALPLAFPLLGITALFHFPRGDRVWGGHSQRVFLVVAVAVTCSLVAFPAAGPIYFFYVAPLLALALLGLLSSWRVQSRVALGSVLAFYLVFALWLHLPGYLGQAHVSPSHAFVLRRLDAPLSGGLRVAASQAREYETLIPLVQAHARGRYIYCTPDCPQVYFLSGKRNPTGSIWDFLDPDFNDVAARSQRILNAVESHGVNEVILHKGPLVESGPVPLLLRAALDREFPRHETVGNFQVRWRASGGSTTRISFTEGECCSLSGHARQDISCHNSAALYSVPACVDETG